MFECRVAGICVMGYCAHKVTGAVLAAHGCSCSANTKPCMHKNGKAVATSDCASFI